MPFPLRPAIRLLVFIALDASGTVLADAPSAAARRFVADDAVVFESEQVVTTAFGFPTPAGLKPVSWSTADGTAVAGADYDANFGKVDAGVVAHSRVGIVRDSTPEPPEYFYIDFHVGGEAPEHYRATVTIVDDKGPELPELVIQDTEIVEGPAGTRTTAKVRVHLTKAPAVTIGTGFISSSKGTAKSNVDFYSVYQFIDFLPGQRDADLTVTIFGDDEAETSEEFRVCLGGVSKGVFLPQGRNGPQICGTVTIRDDDGALLPRLDLSDSMVKEGSVAEFELTLDRPASEPVVVQCETITAGSAYAGEDYEPFKGQVTFAPGETRKLVHVNILSDRKEEADEWFLLVIMDWPEEVADVRRQYGRATVIDHERAPVIAPIIYADDITVAEPHAKSFDVPFTLTLATAAVEPVFVAYYVLDGTAEAFADYGPRFGITEFARGEFRKTVPIRVFADDDVESAESFVVYWFPLGPYDSVQESTVTIAPSQPPRKRAARR